MICKKALAILLSAFLAVMCFSVPAAAETFRYNEDATPEIVVSVKGVDFEEGGPLRITIEVNNFGPKIATGFTLEKATLYFGAYHFDIGGCIKNKKIQPSSRKSYTVKVSAKKVSPRMAVEDLAFLRYYVKYTYKVGDQNHTGTQDCDADLFVVEEDDDI